MKNDIIKDGHFLSESILDKPKDGLDPAVWTKNAEGEYIPTIQASQKIDAVAQWAITKFGITDPVLHITGSIASNSFGDASDIDLHFCSETFKPEDSDEFNKEFRAAFKAEFGEETGSENGFIGVHPIEVYFQINPFQDMMSVGCYNYFERKWESGPEIKDTVFDPYSEYYEKDMKYVDHLISDIRNQILETYEQAMVLLKAEDADFTDDMSKKLYKSLENAGKLFQSIRKTRKVQSSPKSKEDALKKRKDRKWHIADSAFKLLDRFGYLAILKSYAQLTEIPDGKQPLTAAQAVINAVQENITNNKMLTDSEKKCFEMLDEAYVPGMADWREEDLLADITAWLNERIDDYQLDIEILDVALHGSRKNGGFRPDSDLDVIVHYRGTGDGRYEKEDHIWNMLNDSPRCEVDGVTVDFWPTRDEESGDIHAVLDSNRRLLALGEDGIDEGIGSAARAAALAAAMAMPFGAQAKQAYAPPKAPIVQTAKAEKKYAGLSESNMTNLLATIAYNEAMLDWMKDRNDDKIIAILNVVDNRAGKDPDKYAAVISRNSQFFSAKHVRGGYVDATYKPYDPNEDAKAAGGQLSPRQKECWAKCLEYARQMLDKKLPSRIGNRNMIANKAKDNPTAWEAWGKKCDLTIGMHSFGYDSRYDPDAKPAPRQVTYVIKKGDTLGKIAKENKTTVDALLAKNKEITDPNKIRTGQRIII